MIDIYRTVSVASGGKHLYPAVDQLTNHYSKPSSKLPTKFHYVNFKLLGHLRPHWAYIGQVPSLPVDTSLYPELLI